MSVSSAMPRARCPQRKMQLSAMPRALLSASNFCPYEFQSSFPPFFVKQLKLTSLRLALAALPRRHQIFRDFDDRIQSEPNDRQQEQDGEDERRVEIRRALKQDVSKTVIGADEFRDDRSSCRDRRRCFQPTKDHRQRRWKAQIAECLPGCRAHRA